MSIDMWEQARDGCALLGSAARVRWVARVLRDARIYSGLPKSLEPWEAADLVLGAVEACGELAAAAGGGEEQAESDAWDRYLDWLGEDMA